MEALRKIGKKTFVNVSMGFLGATTLLAAYIAYNQYELNNQLHDQVTELEVKLDYNAMETQMAMETFVEIESNLAAIRTREGFVVSNLIADEFSGIDGVEERINNEIDAIEMLITENNMLIEGLKEQAGEKDGRIAAYKKSVTALEYRVADYKEQTQALAAEAAKLKGNLMSAEQKNREIQQELVRSELVVEIQEEELETKDEALSTGYYVVGSFKELKDQHVAERTGGVLGLGSTKTVRDDFNRDRFTKVNIYEMTSIPVFANDPELISIHPEASYRLVHGEKGEVRWIEVLDPEMFWENTKYLVVATKRDLFANSTAHAKF